LFFGRTGQEHVLTGEEIQKISAAEPLKDQEAIKYQQAPLSANPRA
jgi:hypothetical protein